MRLVPQLLLCSAVLAHALELPKLQWAQNEKELWLTVLVPEIEEHEVELSENGMLVEAEDASGVKYRLELDFREFVTPRGSSWTQTASSVMLTIEKRHQHFWDRLVENPRQHGSGMIKMDMSRWKDIPENDEACNFTTQLRPHPSPAATGT